MSRVYLDHNATAPLRPEARAAMVEALAETGNAASVHAEGRAARRRVEAARAAVAALVGADPRAVTFTGGGSEANATVLTPRHSRGGGELRCDDLVVSAVEHASVLAGGRFPAAAVHHVPVDAHGIVRLDRLDALLGELAQAGRRALVSVMLANNETGVVQPVAEVAGIAHRHGALVHTDAVQAVGRVPVDIAALGVDYLTLSAHKLGGPQGAGAVVAASDGLRPAPLVRGGGQERGARAGTENVAGLAGFGAAAAAIDAASASEFERIAGLRAFLEAGLVAISPDVTIFGAGAVRLPNTVAFAVPGLSAETAVIAFDLAGVAVSSGSACSSGKVAASHVLAAMGVGADLVRSGIRVSLGWSTQRADVERCLAVWEDLEKRTRGRVSRAA